MRREERGQGWEDGVGLTHLFDLLLQMLQLRVLLIDEVKLGEVALLHWGRAGKGGVQVNADRKTQRGTQKDRARGVSKDNTETKAERHGQRDIGRERGTETERVKVKEIAMKSQRPRQTERDRKAEK